MPVSEELNRHAHKTTSFPMRCLSMTDIARDRITQNLETVFGHKDFRDNQESIVRAIMSRRDVFAVMPTGGGKSLCYQLPAVTMKGTCLVVSPLISLMKDQVDAARGKGIKAAMINSSQTTAEREEAVDQFESGKLELLYVAPERFPVGRFMDAARRVPLCLVAIDEAHCISEWGHDFRPDYLALPDMLNKLARVPVAAFTATATRRVEEDIIARLKLKRPHLTRASFDRPNLFYEVRPKSNIDHQVLDYVRTRRGQTGIVYRTTRKNVESTARWLRSQGIKARPYHAGLEKEERKTTQEAFDRNRVDVIVATIAFGMGIDKPNIRFIIHADMPKNMEGYYQETGRAGRDGAPAHCVLFFDWGDLPLLKYFISKIRTEKERQIAGDKLEQMIRFATRENCRRKTILNYFGERYSDRNCGGCDVCGREGTKRT